MSIVSLFGAIAAVFVRSRSSNLTIIFFHFSFRFGLASTTEEKKWWTSFLSVSVRCIASSESVLNDLLSFIEVILVNRRRNEFKRIKHNQKKEQNKKRTARDLCFLQLWISMINKIDREGYTHRTILAANEFHLWFIHLTLLLLLLVFSFLSLFFLSFGAFFLFFFVFFGLWISVLFGPA